MHRILSFAIVLGLVAAAWAGIELYQSGRLLTYVAHSPVASAGATAGKVVTIKDLRDDYASAQAGDGKVRVLIVPGHEPSDGGTEFDGVYERDLVAQIGEDLQKFLGADLHYQTYISRDTQAWNPIFADYFQSDWTSIAQWEAAAKNNTANLAALGSAGPPPVDHNAEPIDTALRAYGIIKWSNEHSIDLMLHLHLNDYPGHAADQAGVYSGLVIYTPAKQYANSTTTRAVAEALFKRLTLYNPVDNLPVESAGLIEDPELIATGAYNTADAASMLIEYDFIYEPQFIDPKLRGLALDDLAYQTYLGLQDYFSGYTPTSAASRYDPSRLYAWKTAVASNDGNVKDIYALQTALIMDGDYPPAGESGNDCPHSGYFGACTSAAVREFQHKRGITGEDAAGAQTFAALQKVYYENAAGVQ